MPHEHLEPVGDVLVGWIPVISLAVVVRAIGRPSPEPRRGGS